MPFLGGFDYRTRCGSPYSDTEDPHGFAAALRAEIRNRFPRNRGFPRPVEEDVIDEEVEVPVSLRVINVNAQFRLSLKQDFALSLALVARAAPGKIVQLRRNLVHIRVFPFHGECTVQRNGLVKTSGQQSFEEAKLFAKWLVCEIKKCRVEGPIGICDHKFTIVFLKGRLPFRVNLKKMARTEGASVLFEPELSPFATVCFKEYGVDARVSLNGHVLLTCSGDCKTGNVDMPCANQAAERIANIAAEFMLQGSLVQEVPTDAVEPFEIKEAVDEDLKKTGRRLCFVRRSERLIAQAHLLCGPDDQSDITELDMEDEPMLPHQTDAELEARRVLKFVTALKEKLGRKLFFRVMEEIRCELEKTSSPLLENFRRACPTFGSGTPR